MTTVKFEIVSDKHGLFHVDSLSYADGQLYRYVTQDQYSSIIMKINERMKIFKPSIFLSCLVGIIMLVLMLSVFVIVHITLGSNKDPYLFLTRGLTFLSIMGCMTSWCAAWDRFSDERNAKRFKKLQSDIQQIADEEFLTIYQISYSKWTIEKIGDRVSGKKFKLTVEFRRQQLRETQATTLSVREPIRWRSIQLDPPVETSAAPAVLVLDLEQVPTPLNNEQHSQYEIAPSTPPPPSYNKAVSSFSQAIFTDCSNCSAQKCVYNAKYCTQCGHSLLI